MAARKTNLRSKRTTKPVAKMTKAKVKAVVKAKRKTATRRSKPTPIVTPDVTVTPIIKTLPTAFVHPIVQTVPEPNYKEIHTTQPTRFKLWLTVGLSMAVIMCLWAYSLTQSLLNSSAIEDSSKELQLGDFVDSIGGDLSDLKTQTDAFVNTTENKNTVTPVETNSATGQPSNEQIDNLFSDIQ